MAEEKIDELDNSKAKTYGPVIPGNLTSRLDDEEFFKLYQSGALQTRENQLTEENWEEEIEKIPLFMTKNPTPEQVAASPDLQAMQTILDLDTTPKSRAEYSKGQGNELFSDAKKEKKNRKVQISKYKAAIKKYDEGLAEECGDKELESALLSNKAAVNLQLGNNRQVINDCTKAIELNPKNIKAYWRACLGCMKLELFTDAISFCDQGLHIEPENSNLANDRIKAVKLKAAKEKKERMRAASERKKKAAEDKLKNAIQRRGIKLLKEIDHEVDVGQKALANFNTKVTVDDMNLMHWPVMFMYPEHKQSDYIKDFNEGHSFEAHIANMFGNGPSLPWDSDNKYRPENIEVYFETQAKKTKKGDETKLVQVDPRLSLLEAIRDPNFTVVNLTPTFILVVKDTPFQKQFLMHHEFSGLAVDFSN